MAETTHIYSRTERTGEEAETTHIYSRTERRGEEAETTHIYSRTERTGEEAETTHIYSRTERRDEEAETTHINSRTERRGEDTETAEEEEFRELTINERERRVSKCERCVRGSESKGYEREAVFLCFLCEVYVCVECLPEHRRHEGLTVGRKESERENEREDRESDRTGEHVERERMLEVFVSRFMDESEKERTEKLRNSHTVICDRLNVKHEKDKKDCWVGGVCGLENKRLVVCDEGNSCIKIVKLGSFVLQRYIRFGSKPKGVAEIHLKQNSAELNLVSGSSSNISGTGRTRQDKQCLIAVTLPGKKQILFINLNINPAQLNQVIETEKPCMYIQFYDDKIFTVCKESPDSPFSVYIKSTDGQTLNTINTGFYGYVGPHLAVDSGRVYLTDLYNNKVQCRNVEGQVISEINIKESGPEGIGVDPDSNVYVCAWSHKKVYKLDSKLIRYNSVLDQNTDYIQRPFDLFYYRNKLFINHFDWSPVDLCSYITVVRLL